MNLPGVRTIPHAVHQDARGSFAVVWNLARDGGGFVQDNIIAARGGTLRGLHYQSRRPQGKLLTVLRGEVYEAAVDLRPESPSFGRGAGMLLRAEDRISIWLPPGFAHGFLALGDEVLYHYKVTDEWDPEAAHVLRWDDPDVGIAWPMQAGQAPVLSERDRCGLSLAEVWASLR
jgi:dTDP-4-dehydrorhamnose 3,5-epimerase